MGFSLSYWVCYNFNGYHNITKDLTFILLFFNSISHLIVLIMPPLVATQNTEIEIASHFPYKAKWALGPTKNKSQNFFCPIQESNPRHPTGIHQPFLNKYVNIKNLKRTKNFSNFLKESWS